MTLDLLHINMACHTVWYCLQNVPNLPGDTANLGRWNDMVGVRIYL